MAVTIKQAMVWHKDSIGGSIDELSGGGQITSISVFSEDNPKIGCEIAAQLAQSEIPVAFATVRPNGRKYEAVYGFSSQQDADAALELIKEIGSRKVQLRVVGGKSPKPKGGTGRGVKSKKNNPPRRMKKTA